MRKHEGPHSWLGHRRRRPRRTTHPVTLVLGLLIIVGVAGAVTMAVRVLYSDYAWHSSARSAADAVALAIADFSAIDESEPTPVDAVSADPGPGQVPMADLPYADDLPADVTRIRLTTGGTLSILTRSGALCSGVTFRMTSTSGASSGYFTCGVNAPPLVPPGLQAEPHPASVALDWQPPAGPVEDYAVSYSPNDGATWLVADDAVSAESRATVHSLRNGQRYLFRVAAVNLAGRSAVTTAAATPFTTPDPPSDVRAVGGRSPVVSWRPSVNDGGRPVTGYVVDGSPTGRCTASPPATSCELTDLPAAPKYTFTVRAVNDAGAGPPSRTPSAPVAVYSVPGRPVALTAAPADGAVLLTWTPPLLDGNTPILDYHVEYRPAVDETWIAFAHPPSPLTARAVSGLANGSAYEFRVMAVNAAGVSDPPLSLVTAIPATVPDAPDSLLATDADASVLLEWSEPAFDGGAPLADYAVQYAAAGGPWTAFEHPPATDIRLAVAGLDNGTRYRLRVAAINAMGQGAWSTPVAGRPFTRPGPVRRPTAAGTLTSVDLTWLAPADDGGRRVTGYRIDSRPVDTPDWRVVARVPARQTSVRVPDLVSRAAYDFRIVAVSSAGAGSSNPSRPGAPTLAAVIVDETPPAPTGLTVRAGVGEVTVSWQPSPAGPGSPIESYTVTGTPSGTCTTRRLRCVITGLPNGIEHSFTVLASNASITGPESEPVTATPQAPFNDASGGVVTTFTRDGRTFRVHTFTSTAAFVVLSAARPFDILVVGGGGGSVAATDGTVGPGSGGGVVRAYAASLAPGQVAVTVGGGGGPGADGAASSMAGAGTGAAGTAGSLTPGAPPRGTTAGISGGPVSYGDAGTPTSGSGADGRGTGGGGPGANRGGSGVVIVRYEIAR